MKRPPIYDFDPTATYKPGDYVRYAGYYLYMTETVSGADIVANGIPSSCQVTFSLGDPGEPGPPGVVE